MNLYDRDYTKPLLPNENQEWLKINDKNKEITIAGEQLSVTTNSDSDYPKAVRHLTSLFPNNYLDPEDLQDKKELSRLLDDFKNELEKETSSERKLVKNIKDNKAYFIIASLVKYYGHFGHHDAYLFPEFELGNTYKADYLFAGKGSGGWEFIFIELEVPRESITTKDGNFGCTYRKGFNQIDDWKTWIQSNYSNLETTYNKSKCKEKSLPDEFRTLDINRLHYIVIAGRRADYQPKTYTKRRTENNNITILHYDNLIEKAELIIGQKSYS